jgi:hypothetical protein
MSVEKSNNTIWNRTSDLPICINCVLARGLSLSVKILGREVDQTFPTSADLKNVRRYISISPYTVHYYGEEKDFTFPSPHHYSSRNNLILSHDVNSDNKIFNSKIDSV